MIGGSAYAADNDVNPWHFTVFGGKAVSDSNRPTDNGDLYYGIGIGRYLSPNFSLDLELDRSDLTVDPAALEAFLPGATFNDWSLKSVNLIGRYYWKEPGQARPFFAFGIGNTDHNSIFSQNNDFNVSLGVGVQGDFNDRFFGRFQFMYRYDHDNNSIFRIDSFDDYYLSLGIGANFGGGAAAAPAAAAAAIDPEPQPERDSDGDGVVDSRDRCPNTPAGAEVDQYGCPVDSDGDGVPNARDKCPDTRAGAVVDLDGCEVEAVIDLPGVYFDFDRATLKPEAVAVLDEAAELLNHHTKVVVEVGGHTDSVGTESYNQGLSERRANVVRDYLVGKGVNASRLSAKGYGESRPVAGNDSKEGRAKNRRTELVVLGR